MGRKTWDSIPPRFRPLRDRVNVVVTRDIEPGWACNEADGSVRAGSLDAAARFASDGNLAHQRVFVIGGAQLYNEALPRAETKRILLTRVLDDFECDTFFPVNLGEDGEGQGKGGQWKRRTKAELDAWGGETVVEGVQEENGTKYVFEMWEKT
jgi:dihydrofolate reductase